MGHGPGHLGEFFRRRRRRPWRDQPTTNVPRYQPTTNVPTYQPTCLKSGHTIQSRVEEENDDNGERIQGVQAHVPLRSGIKYPRKGKTHTSIFSYMPLHSGFGFLFRVLDLHLPLSYNLLLSYGLPLSYNLPLSYILRYWTYILGFWTYSLRQLL